MRVVYLYHQSAKPSARSDFMPAQEASRDLHHENISCSFFSWPQSYRPFPLTRPPAPTDIRTLFQELKPAAVSCCSSAQAWNDPSCALSWALTSPLHLHTSAPAMASPRSMGPKPWHHWSLLTWPAFGSTAESAVPGSTRELSWLAQVPHRHRKPRSEYPQWCWKAAPPQTWADCGNSMEGDDLFWPSWGTGRAFHGWKTIVPLLEADTCLWSPLP